MLKFIVKRLALGILTIFFVVTLVFFMIHSIPGSPFSSQSNLPESIRNNVISKYNLDKPLYEQLLTYFDNIAHGDFECL